MLAILVNGHLACCESFGARCEAGVGDTDEALFSLYTKAECQGVPLLGSDDGIAGKERLRHGVIHRIQLRLQSIEELMQALVDDFADVCVDQT